MLKVDFILKQDAAGITTTSVFRNFMTISEVAKLLPLSSSVLIYLLTS